MKISITFCGMLLISVFIRGAFISPSHLSASGSPRLSVKDIAPRRIPRAIAQPNSHTGCFFVFFFTHSHVSSGSPRSVVQLARAVGLAPDAGCTVVSLEGLFIL